MKRFASIVRQRRDVLLGLSAAVVATALLNAGALEPQTGNVIPRLQCVAPFVNGTHPGLNASGTGAYLAVFSYENLTGVARSTLSLDGAVLSYVYSDGVYLPVASAAVTTFLPGFHPSAFAVRFDTEAEWYVADGGPYQVVTVTPSSTPSCEGIPGQQGPQGDQGIQGIQGPPGKDGADGDAGPKGPKGLNWKGQWSGSTFYALDDAVFYGGSSYVLVGFNNGTPPKSPGSNWDLLALQGFDGKDGKDGAQGIQGVPGLPGKDGADGDPGLQGPAGLNWRGQWLLGIHYKTDDAVFFDGSSYVLAGLHHNGTPVSPGSNWTLLAQQGADGKNGKDGEDGTDGKDGLPGVAGPAGNTGPKGPQGIQGIQGIQGEKGEKGDAGAQGLQGIQGIQGIPGLKGDTGDKGDKGDKGDIGPQGPPGDGVISGALIFLPATQAAPIGYTFLGQQTLDLDADPNKSGRGPKVKLLINVYRKN